MDLSNCKAPWLDKKGASMRHIGFRLETMAEYEAAMQHNRDQGICEAMSGRIRAADGNCKWSYVDTRTLIGCYTELYCVDGVALKAFEDFQDGKSNEFILGAPRESSAIR